MSLRALDLQDAQDMAKLHNLSFETAWPEADMVSHLESDICLGIDKPLTGFIIIRSVADQAEILTLAVHPDHRRTGLARQLVSAGELKASEAGADIMFLEVAEDNPRAIALYRSSAYQQISRRPGYYRRQHGRVGALIFRKDL